MINVFFGIPGKWLLQGLWEVGSMVLFVWRTLVETGRRLTHGRAPFRAALFFEQSERAAVGSILLVSLVSIFLGLTTTVLTGYQLQRYGSAHLVPGLVAVSFSRELGALLTGIVLAARSGAAFTAELGTMMVNEEVDAIEAMGIGPLRYLVAPRVLAIILFLPCLAIISNAAALMGAAVISKINFQISFSRFFDLALSALYFRDIWVGIFKAVLFGLIIGVVACYRGLTVEGGAAGVGRATTSSVVTAITTVLFFDMVCNLLVIRVLQ